MTAVPATVSTPAIATTAMTSAGSSTTSTTIAAIAAPVSAPVACALRWGIDPIEVRFVAFLELGSAFDS